MINLDVEMPNIPQYALLSWEDLLLFFLSKAIINSTFLDFEVSVGINKLFAYIILAFRKLQRYYFFNYFLTSRAQLSTDFTFLSKSVWSGMFAQSYCIVEATSVNNTILSCHLDLTKSTLTRVYAVLHHIHGLFSDCILFHNYTINWVNFH